MPSLTRSYAACAVAAALAAGALPAGAQGTLSTQGLGYSTGQLSTQALSTGGGLGEFDPLSPLNPAALSFFGRGGLYFQYDPEFRHIDAGTRRDNTVTARFPIIGAALSLGERFTLGIGASTFLDRSFQSVIQSGQRLGPDSVNYTETFEGRGAINDLRVGLAWRPFNQLSIGVGGHVLTGENRMAITRQFADTQEVGTLSDTLNFSYTGAAVSGGILWRPTRYFGAAVSGRLGGTIRSSANDTAVARASVPNRFGAGLHIDPVEGLTIGASAEYNSWSRLAGLGQPGFMPRNGWDYGIGLELSGQRVNATSTAFRLGARRRTLPFEAAGQQVSESDYSGGFGIPLAGGRAALDLGLQHASRSATSVAARETSWTLSVGLAVRP